MDREMVDVSQYNFPQEIWITIPKTEAIIKITTIVPVVLFGVFANLLLLNIISRNRALRTPTNFLLGNMALADLATLLFCPIMLLCSNLYQNCILGPVGCKLEGFLQGAFLITGVLNLCAVSYDRLTAIVLPMESRFTMRGAKIVMGLTWAAGFLLSTPLAIYRVYRERHWKNFLETYCAENRVILPVYWHVIITAIVWCPLTVMVICYSAIFWKLDRYEQKVLKRENPISVSYKTKVAKMLFIVVITFIAFHVPFTVLIFMRNKLLLKSKKDQVDGSFQILWYISHYLLYVNAAVNPIIYGLTNDNFRRAYCQTPFSFGRVWTNVTKSFRSEQSSKSTKRRFYLGDTNRGEWKNCKAENSNGSGTRLVRFFANNNSNTQTVSTII